MKILAEIMFEMYAQGSGKKTNYPEGFFDAEKRLMDCLSKEQRKIFSEYEIMVTKLRMNEQVSVFEYVLKLFEEPENFVE